MTSVVTSSGRSVTTRRGALTDRLPHGNGQSVHWVLGLGVEALALRIGNQRRCFFQHLASSFRGGPEFAPTELTCLDA